MLSALYREAAELAPGSHELGFWGGLGLVQMGDLEAGIGQMRRAITDHPPWRELLERLPKEVAPAAAQVRAALDQ